MAVRARVDRHKCVGAGNCITLAPTAFDWLAGDFGKSDVVGPDSVDEEVLRAAAFACPTAAIILEDAEELLPWQLRGKTGPARRVMLLGLAGAVSFSPHRWRATLAEIALVLAALGTLWVTFAVGR